MNQHPVNGGLDLSSFHSDPGSQRARQRGMQEAMRQPAEVREIHIHASGVAQVGPGVIALVIGLTTGEQLRILFDEEVLATTIGNLQAALQQSRAASADPDAFPEA